MKIGIVGAENSHTAAVARVLNVEKACGSARVVAVWGETRAFAERAAEQGQIPQIVKRPEDMIGKIDGVMVDHRHPKHHMAAVRPFLEAGIPAFVDKPFSYGLAEGWKVLQLARRKGVAITSYSVLPEQQSFRDDLMKQIEAAGRIYSVLSTGPCDIKSKYGGIFFYGIHQVGLLVQALGPDIETVEVVRAGKGNPNVMAVMTYRNGGPIVTMECVAAGRSEFALRATGEKAIVNYVHRMDANAYLAGTKKFVKMFRTGKAPYTSAEILAPVAVLEALDKAVRTRRCVRVAKLPC